MGTALQQQNVRTLLLITSTVIYMLLGAAVFSALEFDEHLRQKKKYIDIYKRLMEKYNMSSIDVEDLARYLHKRRHVEHSLEPWSFAGSVYFTSVTITTIGE
jgi:Ion channel.